MGLYPGGGTDYEATRALCADCPVRRECLEGGAGRPRPHGAAVGRDEWRRETRDTAGR